MTDETQVEQPVVEPVEQPQAVEAESTPAEVEAVAETVEQEAPIEAPQEPEWFQKRINEITAEKYKERQEKEALARRLEEMQSAVPQPEAPQMPTLADCDYDEAVYTAKIAQYQQDVARQTVQSEYARIQQEQARQAEVESFNNVAIGFQQKGEALKQSNPDYDVTINAIPELPMDTRLALMQSDKGAEIAYYLGKHLDQADRIASLPPIQAAMEIARLESKFSVTPKTVTSAPAPVSSVGGGGSVAKDMYDPNISIEEFRAMYQENLAKNGGR